MIASYYGRSYEAIQKDKAKLTREGMSLFDLAEAARAAGFQTLSVRMSFDVLKQQAKFPCIIHSSDHYAVLIDVTSKEVTVADPARGLVRYTERNFQTKWLTRNNESQPEVIVLLLEPAGEAEKNEVAHRSGWLQYFIRLLLPHKRHVFQLVLCLVGVSIIQLIFPLLTQAVIDKGVNGRNLSLLYLILAGQVMLSISRTALEFTRRWVIYHFSSKVNMSIMTRFLEKLMRLQLHFFDQRQVGDILRRLEDHSRIERFISATALTFIFSIITMIIYSVILVSYSLGVFFVFSFATIIYLGFILLYMKRRRQLDFGKFSELSNHQTSIVHIVQGIVDIKLNGYHEHSRKNWEKTQFRILDINKSIIKLQQYQDGGSMLINEIRNAIITFLSAQAVIEGHLTFGMMLAIQYMVGQLQSPVAEGINFFRDYQDARMSAERIEEIHLLTDEEGTGDEHIPYADIGKKIGIRLTNITFSYPAEPDKNVLNDVSMTIPHGSVTAVVGESGSGKTTILKLLLKLYEPSSGDITVGDRNSALINSRQWREKCGVVMQDGFIFPDSIAQNIVMAQPIDHERLDAAIDMVNLREMIAGLPKGIDSILGADGSGISQGQRQRIMLARAIYKDPDFFFLDEATSSLDSNNEKIIMENLMRVLQGKTVLIIAHRLSTIRNATQIIVLHQGRVVECGRHEELIARNGYYYKLVQNQLAAI